MPSKRGSKTSKASNSSKTNSKVSKNRRSREEDEDVHYKKGKKKIFDDNSDDDVEEFQNSEDEYVSQSGGDTDRESSDDELDSDSANLDVDPDDELDPNEDDKYDPVNENEELEDPDEETDIEDEAGEEEAEEEAEEIEGEGMEGEEGEEGYTAEAKTCHMKNLNKDFLVLDEDDSNMYGKMEYKRIADEDRESDAVMTYYEMVRIIGTRAQQFNFGAEPLVKGLDGLHPAKMAYLELISKMTPYIIRRHLPGKRYEEWKVEELEINHEIKDDFFVPEKFDWDALMKQANEYNNTNIDMSSQNEPVKKSSSKTSQSRVKTSKTTKTNNSGSKSGRKNKGQKIINKYF